MSCAEGLGNIAAYFWPNSLVRLMTLNTGFSLFFAINGKAEDVLIVWVEITFLLTIVEFIFRLVENVLEDKFLKQLTREMVFLIVGVLLMGWGFVLRKGGFNSPWVRYQIVLGFVIVFVSWCEYCFGEEKEFHTADEDHSPFAPAPPAGAGSSGLAF